MKKVKVYFFQKYHVMSDKNVGLSKRRATLQAIAKVEGEPIIETALEIDETELDLDGFQKSDTESE